MKAVFKLAIKNIFRHPVRTFLYFSIISVSTVLVVVCASLNKAGTEAAARFKEDYVAVATVTPRELPESTSSITLSLSDLEKLRASDKVIAYGISYYAGKIAYDEIAHELPDDTIFDKEPTQLIYNNTYSVTAVTNLMLTEHFFCGDSKIEEGSIFSEEDMRYGNRVMIISSRVAEYYGFEVGDTVILSSNLKINAYISFTVKGVYSSKVGYDSCYIPYSSIARIYSSVSGFSYLPSESGRRGYSDNYAFIRMDFVLDSVENARKFVEDAIENYLDTNLFDIEVNDAPYKIAINGINTLLNVSSVVFVSVLLAGTAFVLLIMLMYNTVRKKEKQILRAIGVKRFAVEMMIFMETAIIIVASVSLGIAASIPASEFAIRLADQKQIEDTLQEGSYSEIDIFDGPKSIMERADVKTLNRDMDFALIDSKNESISDSIIPYARPRRDREQVAYRFEKFWVDGVDTELTLVGATWAPFDGFANKASYSNEINLHFRSNMEKPFKAYASVGSGYNVGDIIRLYTLPLDAIAVLDGGRYVNERKMYVTLKIEGVYTGEYGGDLVLPMEELELLCDCVYLHADGYNNDRYDLLVRKEEND